MDPAGDAQIQETLRSLRGSIEEEYPHHLLEKQHTALLGFLAVPWSNFHRLQSGVGLSIEQRIGLLQPITDWYDSHFALFPATIRGRINRINALAQAWISDHGLRTINTPDVISAFTADWNLLREYEAILRRVLARSERSEVSRLTDQEQKPQDVQEDRLEESDAEVIATRSDTDSSFRRHNKLWAIRFEGVPAHIPDSKGMRYIALLLSCPGKALSSLELASEIQTPPPDQAAMSTAISNKEIEIRSECDAGNEVADVRTVQAVKKRLHELAALRQEAEQIGDVLQRKRCDEESEKLERYLNSTEGLGGKRRMFSDSREKARKAVTNRIRCALNAIETVHPSLARHLRSSLRTGASCIYQPEPPVRWDT